jgi:hypothetical protein
MTSNLRNWRLLCLVSVSILLLATTLAAAERHARRGKIGEYNPAAKTVEMFAAIEKGDISVRLIPKDSTESQVLIKNETDQPLNVKLPDAFAGVPVLAQFGGAGGGGAGGGGHHGNHNGNSSGGGNQNQGMGGGMGGMMGGMGGMFNVPPEKVGKFKVPTVCLDHGKAEPRPAIPYTIKPIESYSSKPGVREVCQMLGNGQVNQHAAQAAAWHLNNGMTWEQLAAKRVRHLNGQSRPYFSPAEIQGGMQLATSAVRAAKEKEREKAAKPSAATPSSISSKAK